MVHFIDLRSDTVTAPTPEMRRAMAEAAVGDDVYGEDPTVNDLERRTSEIFGKEAALFLPTGTMGNQIAVHVHTTPGQEIITESRSHLYNYEMGMMAAFSGCLVRCFDSPDGQPTWELLEKKLSTNVPFSSSTGLIVLENSHNFAGGTTLSADATRKVAEEAHEQGVPVHLDGARIFNSAVALGETVAELSAACDSVMFCLSKGLCAPVGSMLLGDNVFIEEARRVRKMLGGGMRQAGVLAAAGLLALEQMPSRLYKDHENARYLAEDIAGLEGFEVCLENVQTNVIMVSTRHLSGRRVVESLRLRNILASVSGSRQVRLLTHKDVSRQEIETVIGAFHELAGLS